MTTTQRITMQAGERLPLTYDYTDASDRPAGVDITTATAAAYELPTLTDVSSTILDSTSATVSSNLVTIQISTPTANRRYKIVTTANGDDSWWRPIEVLEIEVEAP